jgi:hypothetical protein
MIAFTDEFRGTITEGTDSNLESRPYGDDYVTGYIDGGDPAGATGGKLNPLLNNGTAPIAGVGGVPANDDVFDWANDRITSGPDGVAHTVPLPGSDDVADPLIPDGQGQPYSLCIDRGANLLLDTAAATPDDEIERVGPGAGFNQSPNEHGRIIVDVAAHATIGAGWNWQPESRNPAPPPTDLLNSNPDLTLAAILRADDADFRDPNRDRRLDAIRESIGHEGGHGAHLDHYFTLPDAPRTHLIIESCYNPPCANPYTAGSFGEPWPSAAVPVPPWPVDVMCSNLGMPVPNTYHIVSVEQIRLHLKHP